LKINYKKCIYFIVLLFTLYVIVKWVTFSLNTHQNRCTEEYFSYNTDTFTQYDLENLEDNFKENLRKKNLKFLCMQSFTSNTYPFSETNEFVQKYKYDGCVCEGDVSTGKFNLLRERIYNYVVMYNEKLMGYVKELK